jgi:hypothetical protein
VKCLGPKARTWHCSSTHWHCDHRQPVPLSGLCCSSVKGTESLYPPHRATEEKIQEKSYAEPFTKCHRAQGADKWELWLFWTQNNHTEKPLSVSCDLGRTTAEGPWVKFPLSDPSFCIDTKNISRLLLRLLPASIVLLTGKGTHLRISKSCSIMKGSKTLKSMLPWRSNRGWEGCWFYSRSLWGEGIRSHSL